MHQDDREIGGVSPPDYDSALCEQQTILLNRIGVLARDAAIHNPSKNENIYALKQEYNLLVKKRAELTRTPPSDPMEVLPPDLWPDIIRHIVGEPGYRPRCHVDELITLISVSKGWCSLLTTLPVIWRHIWLDQYEPENLAKAMMCIQLSGGCGIDLFIRNLTVEGWRGISSMIVPESRRIQRLSFLIYDPGYMVIRQVLGDFAKFPVLEELFLPHRPSQLSDQQYIRALLMEKMPSIKTVDMREYTKHDEIWNPYLTYCSLEDKSLTKEAVERLTALPRLDGLTFIENAETLENIPSLLKSSFGSVLDFGYEGPDICRRLTWIGNNLSILSTPYPTNGDANALLVALSRFPHLHELTITVWEKPAQNNGHTASPRNSIRVLTFQTRIQDQHDADCNVLFSIFFPASPCLEDLSVYSGLITHMGWHSIQSIKNLQNLKIIDCSIDDSSLIPLNMESLRQFGLTVRSHGLAKLLARLQSKFLQTLQLTKMKPYPLVATTPHTVARAGISLPTVTATPYVVARSAFPNITSLTLSTDSPAIWELRALSKLRVLVLEDHSYSLVNHMMPWVGDVIEAILMRPRDNPALEKITLACIFVEWDILLLMLERRNLLNEPGISSIKTLVFICDLPYRLAYPLSELLGGRFVERDSNQSFSIEAIAERILNESVPGCMQCHYSFRKCESLLPLRYATQIHPEATAGGDKPKEYLVADPPLPLEMTRWLSGRRERLINFVKRYKETGNQSHRPSCCNPTMLLSGRITITGDTLAGAHFGYEL